MHPEPPQYHTSGTINLTRYRDNLLRDKFTEQLISSSSFTFGTKSGQINGGICTPISVFVVALSSLSASQLTEMLLLLI